MEGPAGGVPGERGGEAAGRGEGADGGGADALPTRVFTQPGPQATSHPDPPTDLPPDQPHLRAKNPNPDPPRPGVAG